MAVEKIPITSAEAWHALRQRDVTASIVGAIYGLHPYKTIGAVYHEKKFGISFGDANEETVMMRRGRILEPAVALAVSEERPLWQITKAAEYLRDPDLRLGATPDFYYVDENGKRGVLQAKTSSKWAFDRHWGESPPPWIALQTATEMLLADAEVGCIAALIIDGYNFNCRLYEVPRHPAAEERIRNGVAEFWRNVEAGIQPSIDYERDGDLIALLHPHETKGKRLDLRHDNMLPQLLAERQTLLLQEKQIKARCDAIANEVRAKLGDAEAADFAGGWSATFRTETRSGYTVAEKSGRVLRIRQPAATKQDSD